LLRFSLDPTPPWLGGLRACSKALCPFVAVERWSG
jgi:hypothetical protein